VLLAAARAFMSNLLNTIMLHVAVRQKQPPRQRQFARIIIVCRITAALCWQPAWFRNYASAA
jgi:hypothetical protein